MKTDASFFGDHPQFVFWVGLGIGFFLNIIASQCWEVVVRRRAWNMARKLAGTWVAYNMNGRAVETVPMKGAGLTVVSAKPHWWSANASVLNVQAQDIDEATGQIREHDGHIVCDPAMPWLATRLDRYLDSHELVEQRLVIASDYNTVYVFPVASVATLGDVYGKHAWRRKAD